MDVDNIIKEIKELNIDIKEKDKLISMLLELQSKYMMTKNSFKSYINEIISEIKDNIVK